MVAFFKTEHDDWEGGFIVHEQLIKVHPFTAIFAVGRAGYRREISQHSVDAEAIDKTHRRFKLLNTDMRMAEDLICRDIIRFGSGGN